MGGGSEGPAKERANNVREGQVGRAAFLLPFPLLSLEERQPRFVPQGVPSSARE